MNKLLLSEILNGSAFGMIGKIFSFTIAQYILGKKAVYPMGIAYGYPLWFITIFVIITDISLTPFIYRLLHISSSNIKLLNLLHQKMIMKKEKFEKNKYLNLFIVNFGKLAVVGITAIPLSGGIWTGTILSYILHLKFKETMLLVTIGNSIGAMIFYLSFKGILSIV
ncbi:MAG: hypothetical protein DRH57_01965 [Candidatus Cloacimonadota bacterium]|nr:MAG: hypothetical protein DRH57_01965 [Candidatus Cloacimonadota bacterium]